MTKLDSLTLLHKQISEMIGRREYIGGQQHSYVKKDEVLGWIESAINNKVAPDNHAQDEASPNPSIPESSVTEPARNLHEQATIFCSNDPKGRESHAKQPSNADVAEAATEACISRTGADGWIFANTDQLQRFLDNLKK